MISFRLTDEEYESFRRLCLARGMRNVSELVRTAVNQMLETIETGPAARTQIEYRVGKLESQVADLNHAVEKIEERISGNKGFTRAASH